jgi:hypothetical protein
MTRNHRSRDRRPSLEPLESRTVLSNVVAGQFAHFIWPTNRIPYVIDPSIKDRSAIIEAINEYNDQTTTQWIPRTDQADYVDFAYTNVPALDDAQVGDEMVGEQFVYLNNPDLTSVVLHEMGHTLGLWHEHERNDVAAYVVQHSENLPPGVDLVQPMGSDGADIGPFDYSSIMLYNGLVFSINGRPTLTKPDGTPLPFNTSLSKGDISTIDSLYPVPAGQAQVPRQVVATAESGQIRLAWTDTNSGQATYTVSRAAMGQAFVPIAALGPGSTSYLDATAAHGILYEYMITANVSTGNPAVSQIVYEATPPTTPGRLAASIGPAGQVSLAWDDLYGGTASYVVEMMGMGTGGSWQVIEKLDPGTTSYDVPGGFISNLLQSQYTFRVHAQAGAGASLWVSDSSPTATVGTPPGSGIPPGPGATPVSPPVTPPTVVGELPLYQTVVVGRPKHRVITRPQFVGFELVFSEALDQGRAQNPANYSVSQTIRRGRKRLNAPVGITRAVYNATNHAVSLYLAGTPTFSSGGRLTVNESAPSGITDTSSDYLTGNAAFTILPRARGITR